MTTTEARAHLNMVGLVAKVLSAAEDSDARLLAEWNLYNESWDQLRAFRARCNCGGVLTCSPWVDRLRLVTCRQCGARVKEAAL
jgi:hypothetical protein